MSPTVRATCMFFGSRPIIVAIAVRQIASTSKNGAADASDMLADNIVNAINRETKSMGDSPVFSRLFLQIRPKLSKLCETEAPDIGQYEPIARAICRWCRSSATRQMIEHNAERYDDSIESACLKIVGSLPH